MSGCQLLIPAIHGKLTSSQTESITRLSCPVAIIDSLSKKRKSSGINHAVGVFTIITLDMSSAFVCIVTTTALKLWLMRSPADPLGSSGGAAGWPGSVAV